MIKLDDDLLQELGLGALPPEEKQKLLSHIYETLEMRVGMELAKQMSDAQLKEFEEFMNRNDENGALRWLETKFPHYKDVVAAEFEKLKVEIKQVAPQILNASSYQSPQQNQPVQPPASSQPSYQQPAQYYGQQQAAAHPAQQTPMNSPEGWPGQPTYTQYQQPTSYQPQQPIQQMSAQPQPYQPTPIQPTAPQQQSGAYNPQNPSQQQGYSQQPNQAPQYPPQNPGY